VDDRNGQLKRWILAGTALILVLVLCVPGRSLYRHHRENHDAAQAQAFFVKGDYRNAWLSAQQALLINANNLTACRIMAELADMQRSPASLDWWRRVVEVSPAITNKLLLASVGLSYQQLPFPLTSQILEELSTSATNMPEFHIVSAQLAMAMHRMPEAEAHFEAACTLDPTNRRFQLNLAVIRLGSTNADVVARARTQLAEFATDPSLGPPALRSLISESLLRSDASGALENSTRLLAGQQANLGDRLQHLGILKQLKSSTFDPQLEAVQREAATNAVKAAQMAAWMTADDLSSESAAWLNTLPSTVRNQAPVRLALADSYLATTNWQALRQFTAGGDWGEIDFLRLAFLARAWSELGEPLVAEGDWKSAASSAGDRLGALTELLELAERWNRPREREDLLWRILRRFPDARWALRNLAQIYFAAGNTAGLYQLYSNQMHRSPQDVALKNDLATTALLLKTNLAQAFQLAAEVYGQKSNDPNMVATYAYACHLQGRSADGLAALQKLPPAQLELPSVSLYYGILLRATGHTNEAGRFLAIAQSQGQLLPEEKQLLNPIAEAGSK
jgi:hypothetical protein